METNMLFPYLAVGVVLAFQVFVTWRAWHDEVFDRSEKIAQTQLIWLLPLLGSIFVYSMLADEANHQKGR